MNLLNTDEWLITFLTDVIPRGNNEKEYQYIFHCITPDHTFTHSFESDRKIKMCHFLCEIFKHGNHLHQLRWPKKIYLGSYSNIKHFSRFKDWKDIKKKFSGFSIPLIMSWNKPPTVTVYTNGNPHKIKVDVFDLEPLTPKKIKEADIMKLSQVDDSSSNASSLVKGFALYTMKILETQNELLGESTFKKTISSITEALIVNSWEKEGYSVEDVIGIQKTSSKKASLKNKPLPHLIEVFQFAKEAYRGGRTECFHYGITKEDNWRDYDLKGAYPTAMLMINKPDWNSCRQSNDLSDFTIDKHGFALIDFSFPPGTTLPCIAVNSEAGLCWPLKGENVVVASPEIDLAVRMGATIKVHRGYVFDTNTSFKPFVNSSKLLFDKRIKAKKDGNIIADLLYKNIANCGYGKTSQAVTVNTDKEPSKITCPFYAAFITSTVRALVSEIIWRLDQQGCDVPGLNTDGFVSNATLEQIEYASSGKIASIYRKIRETYFNDSSILEIKHQMKKVLFWNSQGYTAIDPVGDKILLAKGYINIDKVNDVRILNRYFITRFLSRNYKSKYTYTEGNEADVFNDPSVEYEETKISKKLCMDYDFKRKPLDPVLSEHNNFKHVFFKTTPWNTSKDFSDAFTDWKVFRNIRSDILNTPAITHDFTTYNSLNILDNHGYYRNAKHPFKSILNIFMQDLKYLHDHSSDKSIFKSIITKINNATSSTEDIHNHKSKPISNQLYDHLMNNKNTSIQQYATSLSNILANTNCNHTN